MPTEVKRGQEFMFGNRKVVATGSYEKYAIVRYANGKTRPVRCQDLVPIRVHEADLFMRKAERIADAERRRQAFLDSIRTFVASRTKPYYAQQFSLDCPLNDMSASTARRWLRKAGCIYSSKGWIVMGQRPSQQSEQQQPQQEK